PVRAHFEIGHGVAAIDVLVVGDYNLNGPGKDHLADAQLDFADGSQSILPIGFLRDSYYNFRDPAKPAPALFAAWGWDARSLDVFWGHNFAFVVRVPNPHP